jgi:hypothetical protein
MDEWIEEQEKLLNININYKREPVEYIHFHFCYVDADDSIVSLKTEKHTFSGFSEAPQLLSEASLTEAPFMLTEAQLLKIIDEKKQHENINYAFSELSLFHVDLEPENIQTIDPTQKPFFKTFPFISDIPIPPSIFVFHPLNSLFFLFKRRKSILKKRNDNNERNNQKSTKKVAFSLPPSKKHTRRII